MAKPVWCFLLFVFDCLIIAIGSSLAADSPSMFRDVTVIDGFEKASFEYRLDDDISSGFGTTLIRVQRKFVA